MAERLEDLSPEQLDAIYGDEDLEPDLIDDCDQCGRPLAVIVVRHPRICAVCAKHNTSQEEVIDAARPV